MTLVGTLRGTLRLGTPGGLGRESAPAVPDLTGTPTLKMIWASLSLGGAEEAPVRDRPDLRRESLNLASARPYPPSGAGRQNGEPTKR